MGGQVETVWMVSLALWWVPTIVALVLIGRGIAARGRIVGLDVLDIVMVLTFSWVGALVYFLIAFLRRREESRVAVSDSPPVVEGEATVSRVEEAYALAWTEARTAADEDLVDVLREAGLGPSWTEPGRPRADLLLAIWRSGAPPRSASRQLRAALAVRTGLPAEP